MGCLEIDWRVVGMTINGNAINLPTLVVIPLRDKFRARKLLRRQPLFFHVMLKQGKTWFMVGHNDRNPSITTSHAKELLLLPKQNVITCVFFPLSLEQWPDVLIQSVISSMVSSHMTYQ